MHNVGSSPTRQIDIAKSGLKRHFAKMLNIYNISRVQITLSTHIC